MAMGDTVHLWHGMKPADYGCSCEFCSKSIGELRPPDGGYYSRLERRQYYDVQGERDHIARTPLHIARWAVQQYTEAGQWVLDPTIGAGTTAVEALTQNRNVAGMEIQYEKALASNIKKHMTGGRQALIRMGDARQIGVFLHDMGRNYHLVVSNPPYSGDENQKHMKKEVDAKPELAPDKDYKYKDGLPNLAFMKEGPEYWDAISSIYRACADWLVPGGHFVVGVKDMMRSKQLYPIHINYCRILQNIGLEFVGTAFLRHYPGTMFINTYEKKTGIRPPLYQTISVFNKAS